MPINDVNSLALLSAPGRSSAPANGKREELEMRRVAQEFEALLLTQLTASLGPKLDDDEEGSLMRSDATDMYQKMFGEQMAQTMAKQGGIGLTDFMLQHLRAKGDAAPETRQNLANATARAIETARSVRGEASTAVTMPTIQPVANLNAPPAAPASSPEIVPSTLAPSSSSATRPR
ncbi:MAG TPA: rod-binding protein, partial [Pyrinomonadaceae bacterium]|nr:rod-binding protein [Pyrinomonadaceae bacterium]